MKALSLTCSGLLLLALADMPIGYYTLLRIGVTIGAIAVLVQEYNGGITPWIIVFGIIAIVFNPIIPVYLHDRDTWAVIDVIAFILFAIKAFHFTKSPTNA